MSTPYVSKYKKSGKAPPKPIEIEQSSPSRLGDLVIRNQVAELIEEETGTRPKSKRSEDLVPLIEDILGYGVPERFCTSIQKAYKWIVMELVDTKQLKPDPDAWEAWNKEPDVQFVAALRSQAKNGEDHD